MGANPSFLLKKNRSRHKINFKLFCIKMSREEFKSFVKTSSAFFKLFVVNSGLINSVTSKLFIILLGFNSKFNISSEDFVAFIDSINQTDFNYNEITDIFFFQSGRWDIKTKNNHTIKLPKENLKKAFIKASKIIKNNNLDHKLIDLRIPNQVILMNG